MRAPVSFSASKLEVAMTTKTNLPPNFPSVDALKNEARQLRAELSKGANPITHSQSLEAVAKKYGQRDWNTLRALSSAQVKPVFAAGDRVRGAYLGQPFQGKIKAVQSVAPRQWRITIDFDEAVDVVSFDSFSAFRKRVTAVVDDRGVTEETTSDGTPHMDVDVAMTRAGSGHSRPSN